jgi:hypothetical protein
MKTYYLFIILILFLIFNLQNCRTDPSINTSEIKIRKKLVAVTEKYITRQLKEPQKTVSENNIITIADEQKRYVIDPSKIFTGLIDDDLNKDAIVTVSTFQGKYQTVSEQLVILGTGKDFMLATTIESDMRIISLKDRIITADVPEHSRDNPLFNCQSCWEVVKYQFKTGELVRME